MTSKQHFVCDKFSPTLYRIHWRFPDSSMFREIPEYSTFVATVGYSS